jgi:hypothetical protein
MKKKIIAGCMRMAETLLLTWVEHRFKEHCGHFSRIRTQKRLLFGGTNDRRPQ